MSEGYEHIDELERHLSLLRHPSGNQGEKIVELTKWFNSLKPAQKADVFLSVIGKQSRNELP